MAAVAHGVFILVMALCACFYTGCSVAVLFFGWTPPVFLVNTGAMIGSVAFCLVAIRVTLSEK